MWIDSHAHLDFPDFDSDRPDILERARQVGIERILSIGSGTGPESLDCAIQLARLFPMLDATVGIHPHEARLASDADFDRLNHLAQDPSVVAWGEIGLDYHYDFSPREIQNTVLLRQLELAAEADLPVIIHTREAEQATIHFLRTHCKNRPGVMHCFSGSRELAESSLELGFFLSFSGILTFPKASRLREIAAQVPLDRLLLETDCPYLAPVPHRGKRNEPALLLETARCLAKIKDVSLEVLADATCDNYHKLFRRGNKSAKNR
jgi:TatD DNase family protein